MLKEWGRMRRIIHTARYLPDPVYRRKIIWQLNKGESLAYRVRGTAK